MRETEREGVGKEEECVCVSLLFYFPATTIPCMIRNTQHYTYHTHTDPAPAILPMGYNLVKHVLDEKTRKKIHFLGSELHKLELKLSW